VREKHKGGGHAVRLENKPRLPSWFVFANPSFHSIPLTMLVLNASISNDNVTCDHHNNDDTNPTKGLGATQRGEPSHQMATNGNNDNGCSGSDDYRSSSSGSDCRKHRLPQQHPTYNAPEFSVKHVSCDNDDDDGHIDNNDDNDNDGRDDEEEQEGENNEGEQERKNNEEEQEGKNNEEEQEDGRGDDKGGRMRRSTNAGETTRRTGEMTRGETTRRIGETTRRIGETTRRIGKTTRRIGETTRRIGETTRRIGETTRRTGETTKKTGQTTKKTGEMPRRTGETTRRRKGETRETNRSIEQSHRWLCSYLSCT